ncbi:DoxX family protein [Sphingomonas immobilis]|uniref:DoxX family protein n=1 Tax=Sphingomonas immobilis TaxID=3063997 RepID=A0ABT9A1P7_9SPHN|nr:DoxX family protein [Sphingomonas sp. CA1-15]MDO7843761.1 DoxX family protein [Sphingomonas sp. CA1-15]
MPPAPLRTTLRYLLAAAYLAAGVIHILAPAPFVAITPDWVPHPREVVLITGVCEIAGSLALLTPNARLRRLAGILLALYAVCVFPANIKHALDYIEYGKGALTLWYHVPRLMFQPVIVWGCLFAGCAIDWPFRRRSSRNG